MLSFFANQLRLLSGRIQNTGTSSMLPDIIKKTTGKRSHSDKQTVTVIIRAASYIKQVGTHRNSQVTY